MIWSSDMETVYNPNGEEAAFNGEKWNIVVRGYTDPNDKFVVRGGQTHPDDKVLARFDLPCALPKDSVVSANQSVNETFHDALLDCRDLVGAPMFRNKPLSDTERRLFAAAYDAAQKVRANSSILAVHKMVFSFHPSFYLWVDCYARDASGAFWLMFLAYNEPDAKVASKELSIAAYVLEKGGFVPSNATVRIGVWVASMSGARFVEVPNDRIAARDAVIRHLLTPPF